MKSSFSMSEVIKIIVLIVIAVGLFLLLGRIDQYLKNMAIGDCAKISTYTVKDKDATVSYPVQDVYEKCLSDKGINIE